MAEEQEKGILSPEQIALANSYDARDMAGQETAADAEPGTILSPGQIAAVEDFEEKAVDVGLPQPGSSPATPLKTSPLSFTERMATNFGNNEGNVAWLKEKFEDAQYNGNEVVVKHKGKWHTMDPGEVDPYDLTELAIDSMEIASKAAAPVLATAAAAPTVIGVGIGATAGAAFNMSMGRMIGTYKAGSTQQMAAELGFEAVLNMAGYGIFNKLAGSEALKQGFAKVSARPEIQGVLKAFDRIGKYAARKNKNVAMGAAKAVGFTDDGAETMMENPEMVKSTLAEFGIWKGDEELMALPAEKIVKNLTGRNEAVIRDLFNNSRNLLREGYRTRQREVLNTAAAKSFKLDATKLVDDTAQGLIQKGWARQTKSGFLRMTREGREAFKTADVSSALTKQGRQALRRYISNLNQLRKGGTLTGRAGAKQAMELRGKMGEFFMDAVNSQPQLKKILTEVTNPTRKALTEAFGQPGTAMRTNFDKLNAFYSRGIDLVEEAEKVVRTGKAGTDIASIASFNKAVESGTAKRDVFHAIANELGGKQGADALAKHRVNMAAKEVAGWKTHLLDTSLHDVTVRKAARAVYPVSRYLDVAIANKQARDQIKNLGRGLQKTRAAAGYVANRLPGEVGVASTQAMQQAVEPLKLLKNTVQSMPLDAKMSLMQSEDAFPEMVREALRPE